MAKLVQVADLGTSPPWLTLPGGTGALTLDGAEIDDTIFGQTFSSNQPGLISWSIDANALYKGFAGYVATVKKQGTTTAMTGEAMSLESGKIYTVTNTAKDLWDRSVAFTFYDGVSDETANVEWVDYLFGRFKFLDAFTPTGAVTVDGSFFPTVALGKANSFDMTQTADAINNSDFATVQGNTGFNTFIPGLRTVAVDLTGFYDVNNSFRADLIARNEFVVEINPDGSGESLMRGFFKASDTGQSGDVGALEEETISFVLNVPQDPVAGPATASHLRPFAWRHSGSSTLSQAIIVCLNAFENEVLVDCQYLYVGTNGLTGDAVVTDVSLSGGLEVMNEFTVTLQGSGAPTDVGTG